VDVAVYSGPHYDKAIHGSWTVLLQLMAANGNSIIFGFPNYLGTSRPTLITRCRTAYDDLRTNTEELLYAINFVAK
jgi:hypothetical protein